MGWASTNLSSRLPLGAGWALPAKAVRCASCGGQSVERVRDIGFGCTCAKSKK